MKKCFLFTKLIVLCFFCLIYFLPLVMADESLSAPGKLGHFIRDGKLIAKYRTYYLNRQFNLPKTQKSMAVGGWLGYETVPVHGISAGLVGYLSQGFVLTDPDQDGANLLAPGQKSFVVLGQAYLQAEYAKNTVRLFRQKIETPFMNFYDIRMAPVTYEAYTFASSIIPQIDFFISHIKKIKRWNDTKFVTLSEAAGFSGRDDPVTAAGVVWTPTDAYTVQVWEYYCNEFMNVLYVQADAFFELAEDLEITGSLQAFDQQDIGKAVDGDFHTGMVGLQAVLSTCGFDVTLGGTVTNKDHDIVNPWGSCPGFTSIMEEDCNLAGEKALLAGLAYDFNRIGIPGLSAYTYYTQAYMSPDGWFAGPVQREIDLTIDYHFPMQLEGLWLRMRAARVEHSFSTASADYTDYRIILNYDF